MVEENGVHRENHGPAISKLANFITYIYIYDW